MPRIWITRERAEKIAEALDYLMNDAQLLARPGGPPSCFELDPDHLSEPAVLRDELRELLTPSPYEEREG